MPAAPHHVLITWRHTDAQPYFGETPPPPTAPVPVPPAKKRIPWTLILSAAGIGLWFYDHNTKRGR